MKETKFRNYICWGVTALAVIALSIAFAFFLTRFQVMKAGLKAFIGILMPVIYGAVLAYLLLPIYNRTKGKDNQGIIEGRSDSRQPDRSFCDCRGTVLDGDSADLYEYYDAAGRAGGEY